MAEISLQRGEYLPLEVVVTQEGVAVDLTGATIRMVVRSDYPEGSETDDSGAYLVKTVGDGITLTDPTNGEFVIEISEEDTFALEFPQGASEIEFVYGIDVLLAGYLHAMPLAQSTLTVTKKVVKAI